MKWKRVAATFIIVAISLVLTGCCFQHEWEEATCTAPSTCAKCGKTKGEPIEHTWKEATCNDPRTCSVCGTTDGEPKGHDWTNATCEKAKQCNVCGEKEGEALGHDYYSSNKNFACSRCGEEKLFTKAFLKAVVSKRFVRTIGQRMMYCPAVNSSVSCSCIRALISFSIAAISALTSFSKSFSSCNFLHLASSS